MMYFNTFFAIVICFACSERKNTDIKSVDIVKDTFAISALLPDGTVIGRAGKVVISADRKIYVLDNSSNRVLKFDSAGKFIAVVISKRGKGPGELERPNDMDVDFQSNIYISDFTNNRVSIFDKNGNYIHSFQVAGPARLLSLNIDTLIVEQFMIYNQKEENQLSVYDKKGTRLGSICPKKMNTSLELAVANTGNCGRLAKTSNGFIYSFPYPYRIMTYDRKMKLIKEIERDVETFKEPKRSENSNIPSGGITISSSGSRGLITLPNFYFINIMYDENGEIFDLFDESGTCIKNIKKEFKESVIGSDGEGSFFVFENETENEKIVKYQVLIKK